MFRPFKMRPNPFHRVPSFQDASRRVETCRDASPEEILKVWRILFLTSFLLLLWRNTCSDDHPTKKFPPRKKNLCHSLTKEKVVSSENRSSFLAVTISVWTRWAIFGRRAPFLNMGRLRIGTRYVVSDDHPTKKISTEEKKSVSLPY